MTTYTEVLAQSMQRTKEAITAQMLRTAFGRPKEVNLMIHGAKDAIHKQTKTLR